MKITIRHVTELLPLHCSGYFPEKEEVIKYWVRIPWWGITYEAWGGDLTLYFVRHWLELFPKEKIITYYTYKTM